MKDSLNQWLSRRSRLSGVLACGVRFPDKTSLTLSWSSEFATLYLEDAWRCASDAFQVLGVNAFPTERVRWIYEKVLLHCACRKDGIYLGIFTPNDRGAADPGEIERLIAEFCAMRVDAPRA